MQRGRGRFNPKDLASGRFMFPSSDEAYAGLKRHMRSYNVKTGKYKAQAARSRKGRAWQIGSAKDRNTARKTESSKQVGEIMDTRSLYSRDLTWIVKGDEIDNRERDICSVSGFHIQMNLQSRTEVAGRKLFFHWAIVSPKQLGPSNAPSSTRTGCVQPGTFFRAYGASREVDFNDTTLSSIDYNGNAINADSYVVLTRGKALLEPEDNYYDGVGSSAILRRPMSTYQLDKYVKLDRQVRYTDKGVSSPAATEGRCLLVYWCELHNGADVGSLAVENVLAMDHRVITTFRDLTC